MNVLVISRAYGDNKGGMERLSFEMVAALRQDPDVTIKILHHHGARASSPLFTLAAIPAALRAARAADHIHLGDPLLALIGWLIKTIYHKPVSVTVHGLDILYPNPLYQLYLKLFFNKLDAYFPISQYVKKLLEQRPITGRNEVLTPGVSDRYFDPSINRAQLDQLLGQTTHGKIVLLTVGRLVKRKGHTWFIKSVLPNLPENFIYVIAGTGPEKIPAHPRAIKLGQVSSHDLKILYNTVDAFIQPNISVAGDAEGFGLVLLEAALCQRPVFAANLEGIPHAIHDRKNGTLLTSQNSTAWIDALKNFKPQINPTARQYTLDHFSWPQLINHYTAAIKNLRLR